LHQGQIMRMGHDPPDMWGGLRCVGGREGLVGMRHGWLAYGAAQALWVWACVWAWYGHELNGVMQGMHKGGGHVSM
jgi:hypothetical protein